MVNGISLQPQALNQLHWILSLIPVNAAGFSNLEKQENSPIGEGLSVD